jgi:hypothetical protein
MKTIFYAGPDFKRRTLKDVDNVDVAPTIAKLLDIKPPKTPKAEKFRPATTTGTNHEDALLDLQSL